MDENKSDCYCNSRRRVGRNIGESLHRTFQMPEYCPSCTLLPLTEPAKDRDGGRVAALILCPRVMVGHCLARL